MNLVKHNYNWNGSLKYGNKPRMIILHHAEKSQCTVEDIHRWHLNNGWIGIGYNYVVYKDGSIHTGRPESAIGSHTKGYNSCSIGICCVGTYMTETMPEPQFNALIALIKEIMSKYSSSMAIKTHRDLNPTDCPGRNFPIDRIYNTLQGKSSNTTHSRLLKRGSKGNDVLELQRNLIHLGFELPKYGADSDYGEETEKAVEEFQRRFGLSVDGKAGNNTLGKIEEVMSYGVYKVTTNSDPLNVRSLPHGALIGTAPKGSLLRAVGFNGDKSWTKIMYGNTPAWVSSEYITKV